MSLAVVARKDLADARRSKALVALAGLFVLVGLGGTYLYTLLPTMDPSIGPANASGLFDFLAQITALFVAISALVLSYKAIAGETESGSGKLLLGLPHSRRDVFLGKVLGRSSVLFGALLAGLLSTLALAQVLFEDLSLAMFGAFLVVTLVFGLVYVTLMVSLSASTGSTGRAATLAIGTFVVLELLWDGLVFAVAFVGNGFAAPAGGMPTWVMAVNAFSPTIAYQTAVGWTTAWFSGTSISVPFHQHLWFALVVLAVWAVVPALLGYRRYSRADL
ncbi:MAG: ABC transporter permease subunit [Halodesulfurarchaeum sp.]